jgi:hypothetical protein
MLESFNVFAKVDAFCAAASLAALAQLSQLTSRNAEFSRFTLREGA